MFYTKYAIGKTNATIIYEETLERKLFLVMFVVCVRVDTFFISRILSGCREITYLKLITSQSFTYLISILSGTVHTTYVVTKLLEINARS